MPVERTMKFDTPTAIPVTEMYGFIYSDDIYNDFNFEQLYLEYMKIKKER